MLTKAAACLALEDRSAVCDINHPAADMRGGTGVRDVAPIADAN